MKKSIISALFTACLLSSLMSGAQGLKLYKKGLLASDTAIREFTKNISLADGSTVFAGQADEGPVADFSLTKTDAAGNIIWQKVLQHDGIDALNQFCLTSDGGFALVGWTEGLDGLYIDAIVVKTSSTGEVEWSKRISSPDDDEAFGVAAMENGDILVAGATFAGLGNRYGFAFRLDSEGNEIWSNAYKQANFNAFRSVIAMPDKGAMLCGYSWKTGANSSLFDPFFVRVDSLGNIIWAKRKKQNGSQILYDFKKDSDGGILYGGVTSATGSNQNVLGKISASGDHVWAKSFGTPTGDRIWDIALRGNGDIFVAGFADKNNTASTKRNGFIARLNNSGIVQEAIAIGSTDTNTTTFTGLSVNGDYVMANALTYGFGNPFGACLVARLSAYSLLQNCQAATLSMITADLSTSDSTGGQIVDPALLSNESGFIATDNDLVAETVCNFVSTEFPLSEEYFGVMPNPSSAVFQLKVPGSGTKLIQVFSMQGKLLRTLETTGLAIPLSLDGEPAGLYRLRVSCGHIHYAAMLVKE